MPNSFHLNTHYTLLSRTPSVLEILLSGLPDELLFSNEGGESWSPFDIVGHLIHGEKTDWIPRMEIILAQNPGSVFEPFDRFAQFEASKGKSIHQLLKEFRSLREANLAVLTAKNLQPYHLELKGFHPALGEVTLAQLLSTWTVHDLNHIAQIARVIAFQRKDDVGPWKAYLGILAKE